MIALALYVYHALVERRNMKLVNTTARSNSIVTKLFPDTVRDKLFAEEETKQKQECRQSLSGFMTKKGSAECNDTEESRSIASSGEFAAKTTIIADHFSATSILFADMAGFTKWSSVKEPKEVFQLLETVFGAFDEIAKRRGVYKVETVRQKKDSQACTFSIAIICAY